MPPDLALLVVRQLAEHIAEIPAQLHIQRLSVAFLNENNVVFTPSFGVI